MKNLILTRARDAVSSEPVCNESMMVQYGSPKPYSRKYVMPGSHEPSHSSSQCCYLCPHIRGQGFHRGFASSRCIAAILINAHHPSCASWLNRGRREHFTLMSKFESSQPWRPQVIPSTSESQCHFLCNTAASEFLRFLREVIVGGIRALLCRELACKLGAHLHPLAHDLPIPPS